MPHTVSPPGKPGPGPGPGPASGPGSGTWAGNRIIDAVSPVDVGSSTDTQWLTTAAGSFFTIDNPAGAGTTTANVDNAGWELVVTTLPVELMQFGIE